MSRDQKKGIVKEHARHDMAVETLLTDSNDNVFAVTFKDHGARNHETVGMSPRGVGSMDIGTLALMRHNRGGSRVRAQLVLDVFPTITRSRIDRLMNYTKKFTRFEYWSTPENQASTL